MCAGGRFTTRWIELFRREGIRRTEQGPGDLGDRLLRAFERTHGEGAGSTVIVGADSPTLPAGHVFEALRLLCEGSSAVVSPAEDGGYVLIGLRRPVSALFRQVPWGRAEVLEVTGRRAVEAGVALDVIDGWYDVDDADGVRRLLADLARPEAKRRAPSTVRALRRLDASRKGVV